MRFAIPALFVVIVGCGPDAPRVPSEGVAFRVVVPAERRAEAADWLWAAIQAANPKSDEEPEDMIARAEESMLKLYGEATVGIKTWDGTHSCFVPYDSCSARQKRLCRCLFGGRAMNTYGLTLGTCEGLIYAIRQEPALWNRCYDHPSHERGDGMCCVLGAWKRYEVGCFSDWEDTPADRFEIDWFFDTADRFGVGWLGCEEELETSVSLRNLTLGKLRLIHQHLRNEAEYREEVCAWAPAVVEAVPCREEEKTNETCARIS